jgi:hypothetical protein
MLWFKRVGICLLLSAAIAILSCKKNDEMPSVDERKPPKLTAVTPYLVVGSNIDSLELSSVPKYNYDDNEDPYARDWTTSWTCTQKPSGAPDPTILRKNEKTAFARNLMPGTYRFEVRYTTKVMMRSASIDITVMPAKPSGTSVVSAFVHWKQIEEQDWFGPKLALTGTWTKDKAHFYYAGSTQNPRIEFWNPITAEWSTVRQWDTDPSIETYGNALINYEEQTMTIHIQDGVTPDFSKAMLTKPPAVRLTYP